MGLDMFDKVLREREKEFHEHVRDHVRELAARETRLAPEDIPERMNGYERRLLLAHYDHEALASFAERCVAQGPGELSSYEVPKGFTELAERLLLPLLVQRYRELLGDVAELKKLVSGCSPRELEGYLASCRAQRSATPEPA